MKTTSRREIQGRAPEAKFTRLNFLPNDLLNIKYRACGNDLLEMTKCV